jgi:GDP-L-fucose synthase
MEFDSSYSDGQFKKTADNSKLMKLNPDFQFTKIEEGMKKSVKWFIDHFEKCRK